MTTHENLSAEHTLSEADEALISDIRMNVGMDAADEMLAILANG